MIFLSEAQSLLQLAYYNPTEATANQATFVCFQ